MRKEDRELCKSPIMYAMLYCGYVEDSQVFPMILERHPSDFHIEDGAPKLVFDERQALKEIANIFAEEEKYLENFGNSTYCDECDETYTHNYEYCPSCGNKLSRNIKLNRSGLAKAILGACGSICDGMGSCWSDSLWTPLGWNSNLASFFDSAKHHTIVVPERAEVALCDIYFDEETRYPPFHGEQGPLKWTIESF